MIKPASYWALHKTCDAYTIGRVAITLGGQTADPPLNQAEKAIVSIIEQDSEWMEERANELRERWKNRQHKSRVSQNVTVTDGDKGVSRDVTVKNCDKGVSHEKGQCHDTSILPSIHPSIHPSVHPKNNNTNQSSIRSDGTAKPEKVGSESGLVDFSPETKMEMSRLRKAMSADRSGGVIMSGEFDAGMICAYLAGESKSNRLWRSYINAKGEAAVLEECFTFYREMVAGERPDNPGAALNRRLSRLTDTKGGER